MTLHIQTPLIESRPLSLAAGRTVWLKLDALQPCGSFKLRGVGHACEVHHARGARHFVSSSGGNAGLAVAYAGRKLGVPVTVVVPETTTERAKELLRLEDANVVVHGSSWQEANELAQTLLGTGDAFIHPFDDPLLWAGHASLIDEVAASRVKPDAVVLSVGGGGLLSGVVEGLKRNGWDDVPVLAVETTGAASLHAAVQAGHPVELERLASVATSLGAKRVADQALECVRSHPVHSHLVSDRAALEACERFLLDHRVLVEPACGAALALAYEADTLARYSNVLVVVCGGATATLEQIHTWLQQAD
ncbi:pyridoxal-phosphate dependent enzyme [Pseudomonas sp. P1B16]|uniref:L-serine ammonia-lyase n=1 Tax=Pseudomonas capeferrum TaxID=1495066 RepID=A0ABY7R296_9PSED|nr:MULTISPECIES: pyridoxal-phosphate dependent enzyme [Pseudomonas]KEY88753.1 serine dehydratase [Pseudomonas capeferrum]KGI92956.1 serine dehydratase [Pseudomonas sp. H2]MBC3480789.1 pyridoxal-phosphate dependent enzyme [Pseudomonas sp. SWRI77]MCH7301294.1 pyridoxal-phosphate dependent enzyme [Pseudomonas capeferrum]MDD2064206.1 pyridoxal-phosphate dependent enzyme [Pseudomonas sp. 25571]